MAPWINHQHQLLALTLLFSSHSVSLIDGMSTVGASCTLAPPLYHIGVMPCVGVESEHSSNLQRKHCERRLSGVAEGGCARLSEVPRTPWVNHLQHAPTTFCYHSAFTHSLMAVSTVGAWCTLAPSLYHCFCVMLYVRVKQIKFGVERALREEVVRGC